MQPGRQKMDKWINQLKMITSFFWLKLKLVHHETTSFLVFVTGLMDWTASCRTFENLFYATITGALHLNTTGNKNTKNCWFSWCLIVAGAAALSAPRHPEESRCVM